MARNSYDSHDFYCMKCGRKGIPLPRKRGLQHEKFHRKKLYCLSCKEEVNHVECRTYAEKEKFLEDFSNGVFTEEAKASVEFIQKARSIYA